MHFETWNHLRPKIFITYGPTFRSYYSHRKDVSPLILLKYKTLISTGSLICTLRGGRELTLRAVCNTRNAVTSTAIEYRQLGQVRALHPRIIYGWAAAVMRASCVIYDQGRLWTQGAAVWSFYAYLDCIRDVKSLLHL